MLSLRLDCTVFPRIQLSLLNIVLWLVAFCWTKYYLNHDTNVQSDLHLVHIAEPQGIKLIVPNRRECLSLLRKTSQ